MSTQVTLILPDEVYERAERLAQLSQREVTAILAEMIAVSLPALRAGSEAPPAVATLSDEEVLALTDLRLPATEDRRLSALLDRQQAATITETERADLGSLLQLYQEGLLRKAQALEEAVRRGLREPLNA
jgi:hypothetical protein